MAKPNVKKTEPDPAETKATLAAADEIVHMTGDAEDITAKLDSPVTDRVFDSARAIALLREGQRYAMHARSKIAMPEYDQWVKAVSEFLVTNI